MLRAPFRKVQVNLQLRALFRTSFTLHSENIFSGCCFLYVFDKRRKFLAIRICTHCYTNLANLKMSPTFLT